jgi:hypothetical protein
MGRELVMVEPRRLLLQAQLCQALAHRRGARLDLQAAFLDLAQRGGRCLDRVARRGERFLAHQPGLDRGFKLALHFRNRIRGELGGELGDLLLGVLDLLVDDLHRVVDLGDLRHALALAEHRVLQLALGLLRRTPLRDDRVLRGDQRLAGRLQALAGCRDRLVASGDRRLTRRQRLACALGLVVDLGELRLHLGAALPVALLGLGELQLFDLCVVTCFLDA